jgi:hypothetical protein
MTGSTDAHNEVISPKKHKDKCLFGLPATQPAKQ